jgi:F0F1-type ATP synthase assembly protein I
MGVAYQGAMESVFAIALGTGAGWWADRHFDTSPLWLITGATIGFAAFALRLYRLGSTLNASAGEETSPDGDGPE